MPTPTWPDHLAGGILGLLIGDALGVPYEFSCPQDIPPSDQIDMTPPKGFPRAHAGTPPGTWSDDGALALCLLESLLECGRLDPDDLGRRLLAWLNKGHLAVDDRVFDVGITTSRALGRFRSGVPALSCGPDGESSNGNGSLMRVLTLALWHTGPDADLVRDAHRQSLVTHGHPRSQICCALYCLWARIILTGQDPETAWREAAARLRGLYAKETPMLRELEEHVCPDAPPHGMGTGYIVDCLHSARLCLLERCYEAVVKRAIMLGSDTDTTACVAGGIAGLWFGVNGIPERWRNALRGKNLAYPLMGRLVQARTGETGRQDNKPG